MFCAPGEWVPLGIGYWRWGSKNYSLGATGLNKKFDDIFCRMNTIHRHGRRHGGSRVGKRPPWKKSGWAWPTLEILAVV